MFKLKISDKNLTIFTYVMNLVTQINIMKDK